MSNTQTTTASAAQPIASAPTPLGKAVLVLSVMGVALLITGLYTGVVAFTITGVVLWKVDGILRRSGEQVVDIIYVLMLTVSLWMGWGTLIRGFYPRLNAWFIAIGISNFYCCDVSVGLASDLSGTTAGALLNDLVGFFYTPALVLLALSGYRWVGASAGTSVHLAPPAEQQAQARAS